MQTPEPPQLYLISPSEIDLITFPDQLAGLLDTFEIACVRLAMSTQDESTLTRAADTLRQITDARDVALVISDHTILAQRLGLDGVHLNDAARSVRDARKTLGPDAIVGAQCGGSRHDGMTAGEAGADYVAFGPAQSTGLGDGTFAEADLFQWWSEMIEVPCVAEGNLDEATIRTLAPYTDFFGIGEELWQSDEPAVKLRGLINAMS